MKFSWKVTIFHFHCPSHQWQSVCVCVCMWIFNAITSPVNSINSIPEYTDCVHLSWICLWTSTSLFWAFLELFLHDTYVGICVCRCVYVSVRVRVLSTCILCICDNFYACVSLSFRLCLSVYLSMYHYFYTYRRRSCMKPTQIWRWVGYTHKCTHTHGHTHTHTTYQHTNPSSKWMTCILSNACFKCLCTSACAQV